MREVRVVRSDSRDGSRWLLLLRCAGRGTGAPGHAGAVRWTGGVDLQAGGQARGGVDQRAAAAGADRQGDAVARSVRHGGNWLLEVAEGKKLTDTCVVVGHLVA